ncbi:acetyltransferase [Pseudomonas sp. Leaf58]|uniref:acetyltransferase n=1 Tax=Pseudomonas sp. Leaf58 TaxID=1736226 RepID=UPI0006F92A2D|nr:acetyltransferase [Pseudomonas sp. Leaf58]AYG44002.1 acetyltransferase [Pseudomonas sp. Leaf58]KQN57143.1 acetyltransferase [Pseudomonas sp. Leaf58]
MNRLAILGASGHGKVVADAAALCGWTHIDFFDDAWPERSVCGAWSIVGGSTQLLAAVDAYEGVVVAIGNNAIRRAKQQLLEQAGAVMATIIHPAAVVSKHARLGAGSVVFATAVINPFCEVGDGAILNTGCSVDHDCSLGAFVHVSPGARLAGQVQVGDESWVGIGACVRQLTSIGAHVTVGAGAVVVSTVADHLTVVGVPARAVGK